MKARSSSRSWLASLLLAAFGFFHAGCQTAPPAFHATDRVALLEFDRFDEFEPEPGQQGVDVWLSKEITTPMPWTEMVLSWNAPVPAGSLTFEARALYAKEATPFYQLGVWGPPGERRSVNGQKDRFGQVKTDTLVLLEPAPKVQLRVKRQRGAEGQLPKLRRLTASLIDTRAEEKPGPEHRGVWGKTLEVPQRSQLNYEGGRGWCSPTSVSMVLAWWAKELKQPTLDHDVPEVAKGVFDPAWEGTGNWSFNAAYAGQFKELRSCAARLNDLTELERWVAAGVPPICSIDAAKLNGRSAEQDVGHLVVVVGFTENGDVVVNDPWARPGQSVRKTFPRKNFISAWHHSHNTAYLISPAR